MDNEQLIDKIAARIDARRDAEAAIEIILETHPKEDLIFWQRMLEEVRKVFPQEEQKSTPSKMTDEESRQWGQNTKMPAKFKQHAGVKVDSVPINYLLYITEDDDFKRALKRYLASDRIESEIRAGIR